MSSPLSGVPVLNSWHVTWARVLQVSGFQLSKLRQQWPYLINSENGEPKCIFGASLWENYFEFTFKKKSGISLPLKILFYFAFLSFHHCEMLSKSTKIGGRGRQISWKLEKPTHEIPSSTSPTWPQQYSAEPGCQALTRGTGLNASCLRSQKLLNLKTFKGLGLKS